MMCGAIQATDSAKIVQGISQKGSSEFSQNLSAGNAWKRPSTFSGAHARSVALLAMQHCPQDFPSWTMRVAKVAADASQQLLSTIHARASRVRVETRCAA